MVQEIPSSPHHDILMEIISGETGVSSAGFPTIAEASFQKWMQRVPHLFLQGSALLDELQRLEKSGVRNESQRRAIKVLETVIQTAAVTAPTDLWLMKHILSSHQRTGILDHELNLSSHQRTGILNRELKLSSHQQTGILDHELKDFNPQQLRYDFHFLKSRGVCTDAAGQGPYAWTTYSQVQTLIRDFEPIDPALPVNWIPLLTECLAGRSLDAVAHRQLETFLTMPEGLTPAPNWIPGRFEVEVGYRLVPLLLAYRNSSYYKASGHQLIPDKVILSALMNHVLQQAGIVTHEGRATALGLRVLERGPGPFGIIHAYHEYMKQHEALLRGRAAHAWVSRAENVAASQDANKKTFLMINDSIDRFRERSGFPLSVFIEHAVGQGEATRQRYARSGSEGIQYFGADLEDAAIDQAIAAQKRGELPSNMRFVRKADIGDPGYLIEQLKAWGVAVQGSIMVVGNGFHEIRTQTNEKMIAVFKGYQEAGILLIFTEESALSDDDLLHTGWNTYHAGFRYVHELSGQGLRPAYEYDQETDRLSWRACLERAGYRVHPQYTTHTRRIYPVPRENGYNPAISVNYFCVPKNSSSNKTS